MESLITYIEQLSINYNTPEWLIVIVPIAIFLMVIFILVLVVQIFQPKYKRYLQDIFHGMIWKWKYNGGDIIDLWCYCPTCKESLIVDDENCNATKNLGEKITFFVCQECGGNEKGRIKGGDRRYALGIIKREILAKIRLKSFDIYSQMS